MIFHRKNAPKKEKKNSGDADKLNAIRSENILHLINTEKFKILK
jgi:hypothetical protein